jgi:hypothetical protein
MLTCSKQCLKQLPNRGNEGPLALVTLYVASESVLHTQCAVCVPALLLDPTVLFLWVLVPTLEAPLLLSEPCPQFSAFLTDAAVLF